MSSSSKTTMHLPHFSTPLSHCLPLKTSARWQGCHFGALFAAWGNESSNLCWYVIYRVADCYKTYLDGMRLLIHSRGKTCEQVGLDTKYSLFSLVFTKTRLDVVGNKKLPLKMCMGTAKLYPHFGPFCCDTKLGKGGGMTKNWSYTVRPRKCLSKM